MGNLGACCSEISKPQDTQNTQTTEAASSSKPAKISTFHFSHGFTAVNKDPIDTIYTISSDSIGHGSNGIVYRATHKQSKAERAVKSIPRAEDGQVTREVSILRRLDHPNIVKLHETFQDAKRTYLVMELCSGGELLETVMEHYHEERFTEHQAATYFEQVLLAINYLHNCSVAHRDVRSENFLLEDSSERSQIKLIDFGSATDCGDNADLYEKCGNVHYMAPEMIQGAYNKKCDIWSCGVFLCLMLSGTPPFDGNDDEKVLKAVQEGRVDFTDSHWQGISQCAKEFVGLMLTKDPSARSTAEPLIKHQFIRRGDVAGRQPLPSVVKKLKAFKGASTLKKVCLTVIAKQLSNQDIEDLRLFFKQLDKNGDSTISKQELVSGLNQVAKAVPGFDPKHLGSLMASLDSDGSGSIDYTEFIAAALDRNVYQKRDNAWSAFRTFDIDGSGKIEAGELKNVLENAGQKAISNERVAKIMKEADKNNDGYIDFEEFMQLFLDE